MTDLEKTSIEQTVPGDLHLGGLMAAVLAGLVVLWLPAPADLPATAQRLIAVTVVMAILWLFQAVPVAVTSLLPLALYPLLGIVSASDVSAPYGNKNVFLFLGGFLIAMGLEKSGLHRRLALHLVSRVGSGPIPIVFGFMLTTAFLSMWISNTASTMLMMPIALALLSTLRESGKPGEFDRQIAQMNVPVLLGIAYGASCGGFATLIGTPTNVAFRGYWGDQFVAQGYANISAAAWMLTFVPVSLIMILIVGAVLTWRLPRHSPLADLGRNFFRTRLQTLGTMNRSERIVAVLFTVTAVLWLTREPLIFDQFQLLPGWTDLLASAGSQLGIDLSTVPEYVDDATIAVLMGVLLFFIPGEPAENSARQPILTWSETESAMPWGMLILIGSGFAIARAFDKTGLSEWLGGRISMVLEGQPVLVLTFGVCLFVTFLTEFTTNVATLNTLLPVLAAVAVSLDVPPLMLLLPATISASCAFMFPVGTPPNAIVFGTGRVPMAQMARYGLILNLLGVVVITAAMRYWVPLTIDLVRH